MTTFRIVKPSTDAQKQTETVADTWEISLDRAKSWKKPPFQRSLVDGPKLAEVAETIKAEGGVWPGTITLGVLDGDTYLVDGQHRREAFYRSGCLIGYADVRIAHYRTIADMADEFVKVNGHIAPMKPDDIMRGMEASYETLTKIRRRCQFVGYEMIRRGDRSPVIGMSAALRGWAGSAFETPRAGGSSARDIAKVLTMEEADNMIRFLSCCFSAWGRDAGNHQLWNGLNFTACAWLYRRLVLTGYSQKTPKLNDEEFTRCLMSVGAASIYVDWLRGRNLNKRDLSPCYSKLKACFADRIASERGERPRMPDPEFARGGGH